MKNIFRVKMATIVACIGIFANCATVSLDRAKTISTVMGGTENTRLGQYALEKVAQREGVSSFYPLRDGMDALGVRLRLAEAAEKSIDLQYFLMKNDRAGAVLASALLSAADRGVRVRFLLDDVFTTVPDDSFLLINQHPNIELRIFNPLSREGIWALNYVAHFNQANRRMHNKSFTVDNAVSVVGGRNIADEYFQLKTGTLFVDLDVLAVGPIANEVSESFDEYWNHKLAVPIDQFVDQKHKEELATIRAEIREEFDGVHDSIYQQALDSRLLQDLIADRVPFFVGPAMVIADDPDKLVNEIDEEHMKLAQGLGKVLRRAEEEIILVSPYFVPGDSGVEFIRDAVANGIRVLILTNSLASNNHIPVHSAYARYRRDVVRAGAELYELRADAAKEIRGGEGKGPDLTLHTKVFFFDQRYMFIGSLNLDPRSIEINAEMGLFIDSAEMVREYTQSSEERLSEFAYRVVENEDGDLEWHTRIGGRDVVETKEPLTSWWRRFKAWYMKIVPESQL